MIPAAALDPTGLYFEVNPSSDFPDYSLDDERHYVFFYAKKKSCSVPAFPYI